MIVPNSSRWFIVKFCVILFNMKKPLTYCFERQVLFCILAANQLEIVFVVSRAIVDQTDDSIFISIRIISFYQKHIVRLWMFEKKIYLKLCLYFFLTG